MAQDDIQGQVVDGSGNPVSGAIVELTKSYQSSPQDEQVVRRVTTDSNGNYIFDYHPDGDGTTQEWHVSAYSHDGTAYVNSFNNPGVTAELPSNAIPDSVIDNFEEVIYEDQGRSLGDVYVGETSQFSRQQSTVSAGSWALEIGNDGTADSGVITDTDELNYLSPGESAEWYSRGESTGGVTRGPSASFLIGVQSEAGESAVSGYAFDIRYRYESCHIRRIDDGSGTNLYSEDNGTTALPSQTWHRCRVDWGSDDTLRLRVWDGSETLIFDESVTDGTYSSGGVGWADQGDDRDDTGAAWVDDAEMI